MQEEFRGLIEQDNAIAKHRNDCQNLKAQLYSESVAMHMAANAKLN